jgi:short subunit dehydrogenase-like uncharacterized protein
MLAAIMTSDRNFDIVLLGATGFTGGLAAKYLAEVAPQALRWAIAGRNRTKLAAVKTKLEEEFKVHIDIIEADSTDEKSLNRLASKTRVLMTTVGPYCKHGWGVVKACVENGTDYVDITGEPEFVDEIRDRYHEAAQAGGIRIVHCCGFDSIPHDLGVLFTVDQLPKDAAKSIDGFVLANGEFSGGTWHSAINAFSRIRELQKQKRARAETRQKSTRRVRSSAKKVHFNADIQRWVMPLPTIDPEVVLQSARTLSHYGPEFEYGHYMQTKSLGQAVGIMGGVVSLVGFAQVPPLRSLLLRIKKQGDGPSQIRRDKSWFKVRFVARAGETKLITEVSGGDPGYTETAKMITESALCLALDREKLPEQAGVLTPAVAMGQVLIERLIKAGIKFERVEK